MHPSHRGEAAGAAAKERSPRHSLCSIGGRGHSFLACVGVRGLTWLRAHLGPELGPDWGPCIQAERAEGSDPSLLVSRNCVLFVLHVV